MYEIVTTEEGVRQACEHLAQVEAFGLDTETTDLDERKGKLRLIQCASAERTFIFDNKIFNGNDDLNPLRNLLSKSQPRKITQNGKFDCRFINEHLGVEVNGMFDTMLASQIDTSGHRELRHGLDKVAKRYLNEDVPKTERDSQWAGELSEKQYQYAARDAEILLPLRSVLSKNLREKSLVKTAMIEFNAIQPLARMERNGFPVHRGMYQEVVAKLEKERDSLASELRELLGTASDQTEMFGEPVKEINLNSWQQISAAYQRIGVPLVNGTGKAEIKRLVGKYPQLNHLKVYREFEKLMSGFGQNVIELIDPVLWRIFADFRSIGTITGRMSCGDPNLQQIPGREDIRECFRCHPDSGNCLIIADYSQLELRILAHNSGDANMIKGFKSGIDYHTAAAVQFLGISDISKVTKGDRKFSKVLNFAVVYGQGIAATAAMLGISMDAARKVNGIFKKTYRGMDTHLQATVVKGMSEGHVRTNSGRIIYLVYDPEDGYQKSHAERDCKNGPIQGTTGDIIKTVLPVLTKRLEGTSGKIVNLVHDEVIVECKQEDAEELKEVVESTMIEVATEYIYQVPVEVETIIAESWADKDKEKK